MNAWQLSSVAQHRVAALHAADLIEGGLALIAAAIAATAHKGTAGSRHW
jgi:hypothetical protein